MRIPSGVFPVVAAFFACSFAGCGGSTGTVEPAGEPAATIEHFATLAARIGTQAAAGIDSLGGTSASLQVVPGDQAWFLRSAIADAMKARGVLPADSGRTRFAAMLLITDAKTEYQAPRRESLWGTEVMDRIVRLRGELRIDEGGMLRARAPFSEELRDCVPVSSQQRIESTMIPATRSTVPAGGLFADVLEPVVLIAALGVAVLLLFTVRS